MQGLIKEYTTADGCVTFSMISRTTIDVEIRHDQLDRDLPNLTDANENIQNLIFAYKLVLAHTEDIRFDSVDDESEWHDFKQWWDTQKHADELSRWEAFKSMFGRAEINTWVDAYDATRNKTRKAPDTLQPGAEQKAAQDADFLEGDSETSKTGGDSSEESQKPKKPPKRKANDSELVAQSA